MAQDGKVTTDRGTQPPWWGRVLAGALLVVTVVPAIERVVAHRFDAAKSGRKG